MKDPIACVGVGTIGQGWAIAFAKHCDSVRLFDTSVEVALQARDRIHECLSDMAADQHVHNVEQLMDRISIARSLEEAVHDVHYVQESIVEDLAAKRALFQRLGETTVPTCILASSTSTIPGSRFMHDVENPSRCIVVHPINPPWLVPLVEVCRTTLTSDHTVEVCTNFLKRIGRRPAVLDREINGFLVNRLQLAVIGEALHLVGEGYCRPRDVDWAIKYGLGLRWAFMGPFETGHLNDPSGYGSYVRKFEGLTRPILADLKVNHNWDWSLIDRIDEAMSEQIPKTHISAAQSWRNRRLASLMNHLDEAEPFAQSIDPSQSTFG